MQVSDFNHNDFLPGRESEADSQLMVKFFMKEKEDKEATAKEGRPIFREREYIEIRMPGKRDALACRPASEADIKRFPRHYEMFQKRIEMPVEGTPLAEWPQISRSMAEEMAFLQVKTVEQFAAMADSDASQIRGGMAFKQKAQAFLEHSDKTKLISEKQAMEEKLRSQQKQIDELMAMAQAKPKADGPAMEEPPEISESEDDAPPARKSRRRPKAES